MSECEAVSGEIRARAREPRDASAPSGCTVRERYAPARESPGRPNGLYCRNSSGRDTRPRARAQEKYMSECEAVSGEIRARAREPSVCICRNGSSLNGEIRARAREPRRST
jgi:hypothetical protein